MKVNELAEALIGVDPGLEVQVVDWSVHHEREAMFKATAGVEPAHKDTLGFLYPLDEGRKPANVHTFVIRKDFRHER